MGFAQEVDSIILVFESFKAVFDDDFLYVRDGKGNAVPPGDTQVWAPLAGLDTDTVELNIKKALLSHLITRESNNRRDVAQP